jgi:hypothetical protein
VKPKVAKRVNHTDARDSLLARPKLDFTVIINPSSGPGASQYPDEQYIAALNQLAKYPEVNMYSGWASKGKAFAMDGIFFDESPHEYSSAAVDFMLSATRAVKDATGLQSSKTVGVGPMVQEYDGADTRDRSFEIPE